MAAAVRYLELAYVLSLVYWAAAARCWSSWLGKIVALEEYLDKDKKKRREIEVEIEMDCGEVVAVCKRKVPSPALNRDSSRCIMGSVILYKKDDERQI